MKTVLPKPEIPESTINLLKLIVSKRQELGNLANSLMLISKHLDDKRKPMIGKQMGQISVEMYELYAQLHALDSENFMKALSILLLAIETKNSIDISLDIVATLMKREHSPG